jgi:gliding motility-associated-like protein
MKKIVLSILLSFLFFGINAQVTVDNTSQSVEQWVQNVLAGPGVIITNVEFNGSAADALLPNEQVGSFNDVNSDVGLSAGVVLGSGDVTMAAQLNTGGGNSLGGTGNQGVDADLASITPNDIFDESIVEFDFVPAGDTISFNYVFASEEYEEFVCGSVNDAFGFFLSGTNPLGGTYIAQNIALIPDPLNPGIYTTTPVSINTVNQGTNGTTGIPDTTSCSDIDPNWSSYSVFYTPNTTNTYEYDGKTVVLQARAYVNCGETYHIKLAIGDGGDNVWDSGVFLEEGSFTSEAVTVSVVTATGDSTVIEGCADATLNFTRPDTLGDLTVHFAIGGNAINGVDYVQIADSITFLAGQDTATLNINPIADFDFTEGQDTISITAFTINACGDTITSTGYIYILDLPNMIIDSRDTILTCPSNSVPISVQASQALEPFTYSWFTDSINGPSIGSNNDTIIVSGMVTDTFYVSITDSCNLVTLSDTIIVSVTINQPQIDSTTVDSLIHCGETISMQAFMISGTGTAPFSFSWNGLSGNPSSAFSPIADSTIYVTVTDFCGLTDLDSVLLTVDTIPITIDTLSMNDTINCGESISLGASATNGTYIPQYFWNGTQSNPIVVSPNTTTTYILEATGNCNVNAFDTVLITVDTIPVTINVINDTTLFCLNDPLNLVATPTDGISTYSYTWDVVNPPVNTSNPNPYPISPGSSATYYVLAEGGCNTSLLDSVIVTVDYTPITLDLTDDIELLCENLLYNVDVNATVTNGSPPYSYDWGPSILDTTNSITINGISNPGQIVSLTVTDGCNTQITETMNITFRPYEDMVIVALPVDSVCIGESISLSLTATDGIPSYTFSWNDGVNSYTGNEPLYTSLIAGINNVVLTASDQCKTTTTSVDVLVIPCAVNIPNVITPNGDSNNDFLVFENLEFFPENKLQIFNRWGNKIYEKESYQNDWYGKDYSEGTYFFILELNNFDKTLHKGTFTLLK